MLAQQEFIWIRLVMNSTLPDLHPACKRLFQCRLLTGCSRLTRTCVARPSVCIALCALREPPAHGERQSEFPYRCWSGRATFYFGNVSTSVKGKNSFVRSFTVLSRRTCKKSLMQRARIADFSAAIADCYFRSHENHATISLCFC